MNQSDPQTTIHEACARAIEWKCRGHVAHEHLFLDTVIERIRAVPRQDKAYEIYTAVLTDLTQMNADLEAEGPAYANKARLVADSITRISEEVGARMDDPMNIYSDHHKWWPMVEAA